MQWQQQQQNVNFVIWLNVFILYIFYNKKLFVALYIFALVLPPVKATDLFFCIFVVAASTSSQ